MQSVTEEEVQKGLLENPNAEKQAFFFDREYTNIDLSHSDAGRFVDMSSMIHDIRGE